MDTANQKKSKKLLKPKEDILVDFILKSANRGFPFTHRLLNLTQMLFWQTGLVMIIPVLERSGYTHFLIGTGTKSRLTGANLSTCRSPSPEPRCCEALGLSGSGIDSETRNTKGEHLQDG